MGKTAPLLQTVQT